MKSKSVYGFDEDLVNGFVFDEAAILERNSKAVHALVGVKQPKRVGAVVEAAHQPLFYPPEWFFNKFRVAQELANAEGETFVFGFADNDFFLFNRLWRGEGKALSWNWYKTQPHHVSFNKILLPESLKGEFPRAKTLSEFNMCWIARKAEELGFKPYYYSYSSLPNLSRQIVWFVKNAVAFRKAFNASLKAHKDTVRGILPMAEGELPLWRVFEDGRKETVLENDLSGKIEFKAVARSFAMSSFLKTRVYVAGRGEANSYGIIAKDIASALNYALPETVVV